MRKGIVVSVIEYQGSESPYRRFHCWHTVAIICGVDRKQVLEQCLSRFRVPEIADGLRRQLGEFIEARGEQSFELLRDNRTRFDFAPESPNTTGDGRGGTLYISNCEIC